MDQTAHVLTGTLMSFLFRPVLHLTLNLSTKTSMNICAAQRQMNVNRTTDHRMKCVKVQQSLRDNR